MKSFKNKTILLTGAGGGLGQEMIRQFSKEGSRLILNDLKGSDLGPWSPENPNNKNILGFIPANLSQEKECIRLYKEISKNYPKIDILINNAGIASFGHYADVPWEKARDIININLQAPMHLSSLFLEDLKRGGGTALVFISSVAGLSAPPGLAAYCSSKFGIRAFGDSLSHELKADNVQVFNLYPFFTKTNILDSPQFGVNKKASLPGFICDEPEAVIKELIQGMKKGKTHIYPGITSKMINISKNFLPGLLNDFSRFMLKVGGIK